jgi:inner membrane protein
MDNLTHTLIGLVAGDSVARSTRPTNGGLPAQARRGLFVTLAAIGGNMPDLDLLYSAGAFTSDKIAYLLHHRGHTHTIVGCLGLALILYGGAELWVRHRRLTLTRGDRFALLGMAIFATLLHLGMDALNSYGVHPFWPFNNEWFYGDSVFIVEPLYWIAAAPMLFLVRTMLARILIGLVLLLALAAHVFAHQAQPAWTIGVALLTIALLVVGKRASPRTAALTSAAVTVGVTAMFIVAGQAAAHRIDAIAEQGFPAEQGVDRVLSPSPTNPLCWDVLLVQTGGGKYIVRHGMLANAPSLLPPGECFGVFSGQLSTAPMTPVPAASANAAPSAVGSPPATASPLSSVGAAGAVNPAPPAVRWLAQFSMPEDRLASLAAQDCAAYEVLQFARAPYAAEVDGRWVIGDLRFDRERALGMTEIEVADPPGSPCRYHVPWVPPRAALLGRAGRPLAASP